MGDVAAVGVLRADLGPGVLWAPRRARRCLFGTPDHDVTETFLENETKKLEQKNRDRWNFDFVQGTPLEGGRFAWMPVMKDAACSEKDEASSEKDDHDDAGCPASSSIKRKEVQMQITDFMRKRKYSSNQKEKMTTEPQPKTRRRFST